jgi:hypothetical protein
MIINNYILRISGGGCPCCGRRKFGYGCGHKHRMNKGRNIQKKSKKGKK